MKHLHLVLLSIFCFLGIKVWASNVCDTIPTRQLNEIVYDMTRNLKLTFIWRFNGFKPKDNSIDTSRFGTGK